MKPLLWSLSPTVWDTFYQRRVVRFIAWICPCCERRNRTVVHRGAVTGGPNGRPMTREEIEAEYGRGGASLAWAMGLVPGGEDEPTWSFGPDEDGAWPGGFVPTVCGVCCQRSILSQHATSPAMGVLGKLRDGDPMIPYHDPLGAAWSASQPDPKAEAVL
jgi:hypothetical protein